MLYFWWGCRGNLKLITLGSEQVQNIQLSFLTTNQYLEKPGCSVSSAFNVHNYHITTVISACLPLILSLQSSGTSSWTLYSGQQCPEPCLSRHIYCVHEWLSCWVAAGSSLPLPSCAQQKGECHFSWWAAGCIAPALFLGITLCASCPSCPIFSSSLVSSSTCLMRMMLIRASFGLADVLQYLLQRENKEMTMTALVSCWSGLWTI